MEQMTLQTMIEIPPRMVLELASGIRDGADIAADYGYSVEQWVAMKAFPPIVKAVDEKKAELKASGWSFRAKCGWMAEELLEDLYTKAKDKEVSFSALLETIKFTAKAAGTDAPPKVEASIGNSFSININLGNGQTVKVDVGQTPPALEASDDVEDAVIVDDEMDQLLSNVPRHLLGASTHMNQGLL